MLKFVKLPATKIDYVGSTSNYQLPRLMHQLPTNYTYYTYITILKRKFLIKILPPPPHKKRSLKKLGSFQKLFMLLYNSFICSLNSSMDISNFIVLIAPVVITMLSSTYPLLESILSIEYSS